MGVLLDTILASTEEIHTYYVFSLESCLYAIDIDKIKEIRVGYQDYIYPVSGLKSSILGVIDSGTTKLPVLDLALKLGIRKSQKPSRHPTVVIIDTVENKQIGLLMDTCIGVTNNEIDNVTATSLFDPYVKQYFVSNRFSGCDEIINILDADAFGEQL